MRLSSSEKSRNPSAVLSQFVAKSKYYINHVNKPSHDDERTRMNSCGYYILSHFVDCQCLIRRYLKMENFLKQLKKMWSKTNRWHRVIFVFLLVELQVLPSRQLGFRCKDPALSYPFTGDTISFKWLLAVTLLLPLVLMLIVERIYNADQQRSKRRVLRWYKEYLYGFLINLTLIQTMKTIVGSPRPHFFDTCEPKEALTCNESDYVSSYTCTKAHWLNQSDRSFPSGHTSLALHAGLFIVYYLHRRTVRSDLAHQHAVRTLQTLSAAASLYCAVSRMTDHRHHWWDVLAGAAVAVAVVIYTIFQCRNFKCSTSKKENVPKEIPIVRESKEDIVKQDSTTNERNGNHPTLVHKIT